MLLCSNQAVKQYGNLLSKNIILILMETIGLVYSTHYFHQYPHGLHNQTVNVILMEGSGEQSSISYNVRKLNSLAYEQTQSTLKHDSDLNTTIGNKISHFSCLINT